MQTHCTRIYNICDSIQYARTGPFPMPLSFWLTPVSKGLNVASLFYLLRLAKGLRRVLRFGFRSEKTGRAFRYTVKIPSHVATIFYKVTHKFPRVFSRAKFARPKRLRWTSRQFRCNLSSPGLEVGWKFR